MPSKSASWVKKLWGFFSSMKLGLALLGVIAFVAAIGTLVPQTSEDPTKSAAVSQIWQTLGFTNLYSSAFFLLLLGMLCINLIACSVQRFRGIYLKTFKPKTPQNLARVSLKVRKEIKGESGHLRQAVEGALQNKGYYVVTAETETGWSFTGLKRRWGHWGSLLSHIALIFLVIGALIGSLIGFKGSFMAGEGSIVPLQSIEVSKGKVTEDFSVRINSAQDRFLPNGERDNWYTNLSILENGEEVASQTLSVNHPFTYKGVTLYQASFLDGAHFTAEIKGQKIPVLLQDQGENHFQAPGTDLYLIIASIKISPQPMVFFQVYQGTSPAPVQTGQLGISQSANIQGKYQLTLNNIAGFTGLQVKRDPGVPVIWLGSTILIAGLLLSFYWRPFAVFGIWESTEDGVGKLTLGISSAKFAEGARKEFEDLLARVKGR